MPRPIKGAAFNVGVSLYKNDGTLVANPGTVTAKISKDFGDYADVGTVTEEDSTYSQLKLALTATEMNADVVSLYVTDNTAGTVPWTATIYTEPEAATAAALATVDDLVDDLESRLTAARAGYLDALNTGVTLAATQAAYAPAKAGDAMTLTAAYDAAKAAASQTSVNTIDGLVDKFFDGTAEISIKGIEITPAPSGIPVTINSGGIGIPAIWTDSSLLSNGPASVSPASIASIANAVRDLATSGLAALKTLIDGIKAKTDTIPANPAAIGSAMTLTAAYDAAKAAASQASVSAIPTTPLLAEDYTAPDNASITAILEDTGTTIPAALTTIDNLIDTEIGTLLVNVAAVKAKTDNLPPNTAAQLATIDGVVDDILVDTGTTLPAAISGLNDFDPATDVVAHVTLVDTCTENTDMRGTDLHYEPPV